MNKSYIKPAKVLGYVERFKEQVKKVHPGETMTKLASLSGIHKVTLSHWLRGLRSPSVKRLREVAEALELDTTYIFAGSGISFNTDRSTRRAKARQFDKLQELYRDCPGTTAGTMYTRECAIQLQDLLLTYELGNKLLVDYTSMAMPVFIVFLEVAGDIYEVYLYESALDINFSLQKRTGLLGEVTRVMYGAVSESAIKDMCFQLFKLQRQAHKAKVRASSGSSPTKRAHVDPNAAAKLFSANASQVK